MTAPRLWTASDMAVLEEMASHGRPMGEIAIVLGRSPAAVQIRRQRFLPKALDPDVNYGFGHGRRGKYWTQERLDAGLRDFASKHKGMLPNSDHEYSHIKKGHLEWPTAACILDVFGTMADAWASIGEGRKRVTRQWVEWTQEDDDYLLDHAGDQTLRVIAGHLGRSWSACKRRLYDLGAGRARDVSGLLSASQVAKLYDCPLARVKRLIDSGELPARKVQGGHYWRIDPDDCERLRAVLSAPKRRSYQGREADHGDYERRYGLMRVVRDGKVVRVPRPNVATKDGDGIHVPLTRFRPVERRHAVVGG